MSVLQALADIDPGGADSHALIAVDAVARGQALQLQDLVLLHRAAWFATVVAICDVQRIFVGQRGLNARPWTHIGADLLAHEARERVCREGQDTDPEIGDIRRLEGGQVVHEGRSIGEIEHPGTASPPGDHQPDKVL